tara:strand:+ start:406 stop:648 length:243 start_codon:yes stop_codon:yes gene_type:complete
MESLWNRLRPEYKKTIESYIKSGKYTSGPQYTKKTLEKYTFFGELTIDELKNVFTWTDNDIIDIEWKDLFGDRFLTEEKK